MPHTRLIFYRLNLLIIGILMFTITSMQLSAATKNLYFQWQLAQLSTFDESGGSGHALHMDEFMVREHTNILNLVPTAEATHMALRSGNWFDPTVWLAGSVPGDGAKVHVPRGVNILYGGLSDSRIKWLRIDGEMRFDTNTKSKLLIDTWVVTEFGKVTIGTKERLMIENVDILFTSDEDIDVMWDPGLLSRGLVTKGAISIHGKEKYVHGKVATNPMQGDTSIVMADTPIGWESGDVIVIAGSDYLGYTWDNTIRQTRWWGTEDEVRTITSVDGKRVYFNEPLEFSHNTPRSDLKVSVANYSRSITFESELGDRAALHRRGHTMFMHNHNIDIRYAAFNHLGRTDKSQDSSEVGALNPVLPNSNARGRYSLHIHRSGVENLERPVIVLGNAVFDSPSWGYVHHDSNAIFHNNASFATFGAGFVAETGNEVGTWTNNIAIFAQGLNRMFKNSGSGFDTAAHGVGFWFQGRMVQARNNVAASTRGGYVFMHRSSSVEAGTGMIDFIPDIYSFPFVVEQGLRHPHADVKKDRRLIRGDNPPILAFNDNETFASDTGLHVVKANPRQGTTLFSDFNRFTAWGVMHGSHFEYTGHYVARDFDVVGRTSRQYKSPQVGIRFGNNTSNMTAVNPKVTNFKTGIDLSKTFTTSDTTNIIPHVNYVVVNPVFQNVGVSYQGYDPQFDKILTSKDVPVQSFSVALEPLQMVNQSVQVIGVQRDGVGEFEIVNRGHPLDSMTISSDVVTWLLASDGYRNNPDGNLYFIVKKLFSDRLTGELFKKGNIVKIEEGLPIGTSNQQYHRYRAAFNAGPVDLESQVPIVQNMAVVVPPNTNFLIKNLLQKAHDPDGDKLRISGFTHPSHGLALMQGNDIMYRPDFDFRGEDRIKFWVTDGNGNYTSAWVIIKVDTDTTLPAVPDPVPTVTLAANPTTIIAGQSATLTWSSTHATNCTASDSWSGSQLVSGTRTVSPVQTSTYTLTCTGVGGSASNQAIITVEQVADEPEEDSFEFQPGDRVKTTDRVNVRQTPGQRVVGQQVAGATGIVTNQAPVVRSGYTWVFIDFDSGVDGWVATDFLIKETD